MSFAINVEGFSGRFAEELAMVSDKSEAIRRTVAKTIEMYEDLRAAEAYGDVFVTVYLDALEDAIDRIDLTDRQEHILRELMAGTAEHKLAAALGINRSVVSRQKAAIIEKLAKEYARAPKSIWK